MDYCVGTLSLKVGELPSLGEQGNTPPVRVTLCFHSEMCAGYVIYIYHVYIYISYIYISCIYIYIMYISCIYHIYHIYIYHVYIIYIIVTYISHIYIYIYPYLLGE